MYPAKSITSVTACLFLIIPGVYATPQRIQGFSTDDMFDLDARPLAETRMGVDGRLSSGYTHHPRKMKIKLEADSDSQSVFDNWAAAQDTLLDVIHAYGTVVLEANGTEYLLTKGALTSYPDMPGAKKTLQPQTYEITWESVTKAGI